MEQKDRLQEQKYRIQEKANEMFMRYGIRSVSMDDIAGQLGMSKKTLYQYFSDKDELVEAVMQDEVQHGQKDCQRCFEQSENAIQEIFYIMESIVDQFRHINPMLIYDLQKFHYSAYQKFLIYKNDFLLRVIRDNLERGIHEGLYRKEINVDVVSKFRLQSMMIGFDIEAFPPAKYNLAEVTQEIMKHYLYGIVSLEGYKLILNYQREQTKNG